MKQTNQNGLTGANSTNDTELHNEERTRHSNALANILNPSSPVDISMNGNRYLYPLTVRNDGSWGSQAETHDCQQEAATSADIRNSPVAEKVLRPPTQPVPAHLPRLGFLSSITGHDCILPCGPPLNFTLVEIVAILPHWFKNHDILSRFLNNGFSAPVHIAILQEFRSIDLSESEAARAKDAISDLYRKTMRKFNKDWSKATHMAPRGWNSKDLMVNSFYPDTLAEKPSTEADHIPFKYLSNGTSKLPQDSDAGDLTRALDHALRVQKPDGKDFIFPDDIHTILSHIGYVTVTTNHTDAAAIGRYDHMVKKAYAAYRKRRQELEEAGIPLPPAKRGHKANARFREQIPKHAANVSALDDIQTNKNHSATQTSPTLSSQIESVPQMAMISASNIPEADFQPDLTIDDFKFSDYFSTEPIVQQNDEGFIDQNETTSPYWQSDGTYNQGMVDIEEIDAIIEANQEYAFTDTFMDASNADPSLINVEEILSGFSPAEHFSQYGPTQLLCECVEADDPTDHSDLARAARWCRDPANSAGHYLIEHIWLALSLKSTLHEARSFQREMS